MKNLSLPVLVLLLFAAPAGAMDVETLYGPRIEVGGGGGYTFESTRMAWSSSSYSTGIVTAALRLFDGLGLQGGIEYGRGSNPHNDSFPFGEKMLALNGKVYQTSYWTGARYELPLSRIGKEVFGIQSIYCGAGVCWTEYGVKSSSETDPVTQENTQLLAQYKTARLSGPYMIAAARWRIMASEDENTNPWAGSFCIDAGVRSSMFGTSRMASSNIAAPPDDYRSTQIFIFLLMKLRLFE